MKKFTELDIVAYDLYIKYKGQDDFGNSKPVIGISDFIKEKNRIDINYYYIKSKNIIRLEKLNEINDGRAYFIRL